MSGLREAIQAAMAGGVRATDEILAPLRAEPLLALVKEMQPELTSPLPKVVPTALYILAAASVSRAPPSSQEAAVLVDFYASKVGHFTTIDSAIEGLSRIVCWGITAAPDAFNRGEIITTIVTRVLARIQVQSMFGRSKVAAMDLIDAITSAASIDVVAECCGRDFLSVFLTCVDGEREPELVLKMIVMTQRLVTSFPASHLTFFVEDLFVTVSSYFPVLFNPPPHCAVTRQMLKDALHPLMLMPVFHEHCIPFLFAKLTSPASSAKHDALALLAALFTSPSADGGSPYPPSLLQPHISDTLAVLRGEVVKMVQLTSVMGGDGAVQAVLRATLDVVSRMGEVLGQGYSDSNILSMCDHSLLAPVVSLVDSGSDSRAYAVLLHALTKRSPAVCAAVCAYLVPTLGWKLAELHTKLLAASPLEVRRINSSLTVVGAILSSVEMIKNGTTYAGGHAETQPFRCGLNAEIVADILPTVCAIVEGTCPSSALHLTPLCADIVATYIAVADLIPTAAEGANSGASATTDTKIKLLQMLAMRVFTYEREPGDDEVPIAVAKAISNVGRVERDVVHEALLGGPVPFVINRRHEATLPILLDALLSLSDLQVAASVCGFLLFGVVGAEGLRSSRSPVVDGSSTKDSIILAASDTHGSSSVIVAKYVAICIEHIGSVVGSDAAKIMWLFAMLNESPLVLAVVDSCSQGPDLLSLLLDMLVKASQTNTDATATFDTILSRSNSAVLWACAVAVAPTTTFAAMEPAAVGAWFERALALLPVNQAGSDATAQVRELCALRSMASIANKSSELPYSPAADADIRIVAAVAKGRLARGASEGVLACCAPLFGWLHASTTRSLVDTAHAFGSLLSNPQPSVSAPFWRQRTYCTLLEHLLQPSLDAGHVTRSLLAVRALVASAGVAVVDPTSVSNLEAITTLGLAAANAAGSQHVASECSAATGLCLIQYMSLAEGGLSPEALRKAAALFLIHAPLAEAVRLAVAPPPRERLPAGVAPRVVVPYPLEVRLQVIEVHRRLLGFVLGLSDSDDDEADAVGEQGVGLHLSAAKGGGIRASADDLRSKAVAQKSHVMAWLANCQDDRKRLVRAAAAEARHEWFQLKD